MACPQQQDIDAKRTEKLTKYRQLAFETRERRPGYDITVILVIIGTLGGEMKRLRAEHKEVFQKDKHIDKIAGEMQRTVLIDSESIVRRVISGLIQGQEME